MTTKDTASVTAVTSTDATAPWKQNAIDVEATASPAISHEGTEVTISDVGSALSVVDEEPSELTTSGNRTYSSKPDIRLDEMLVPKLRMAQGQTAEVLSGDARPGQWVLLGNEASNEAEVVILAMGRARELRQRGGGDDDGKVLCRSSDAVFGVGEPGGVCERCPMQEWTEENGKRKAPPCAQIYSFQAFSLTHQALCLVEFKRTGLDAAKLINTMIASRGMGNFVIKLSGEKREAGRTTFYVPKVMPRPISQDERNLAAMFIPQAS